MNFITGFGNELVSTFLAMAPYLLLGLTFAGILHIVFRKELVQRHLGGGTFMSSFKAAVLGVPLPLCSCGVIPTAMSLRKNNASEGATMSFLISTPQTGVDSIVATWGMLGPLYAVFRPVAAFVMGVAGGVVANIWGADAQKSAEVERGKTDNCPVCMVDEPHTHSLVEKLHAMVKYAYGDFLDDISAQLIVGLVISALISFFLPADFFAKYVGNTLIEMLIMVAGGIPLYVCATASIPIAAALMMKGLSPGAAFVFLAVGPATNAASIVVIGNVMGKRFLSIYLSVIAAGAMLAGFVLNFFYAMHPSHLLLMHQHIHMLSHSLMSWGSLFSLVFLVMLLLSLGRKYWPAVRGWFRRAPQAGASASAVGAIELTVNGMTCNHCAHNVRESVLALAGVEEVAVDLIAKRATVKGTASVAAVKSAIVAAGYEVL